MNHESDLLGALVAVVRALESRGISYFITGSVASSIQGEYRATNDVDLVARIESADIEPLLAQLESEFVADAEQALQALASGSAFNLIHRHSYLKVDVFPSRTEFDRQVEERAERVVPPGTGVALKVATTEDILLAKMRWYRLGDEESQVQRRDIEGLILLNADSLDVQYVRDWAVRLGLSDLVDRFLP